MLIWYVVVRVRREEGGNGQGTKYMNKQSQRKKVLEKLEKINKKD